MSFSDNKTIKVVCSWCKAVNDIPVKWLDSGDGFFTNGLDQCWYCHKLFWWEMEKETVDKLIGNLPIEKR